MKISSLRVDSIKSTLQKRLSKKTKTTSQPSHVKSTVHESRDDEGAENIAESRDDGLRDWDEIEETHDREVVAEIKGSKLKDDAAKHIEAVRVKVKELMSPMLRANALKKRHVPKVSKILKINALRQESVEGAEFAELKETPSVIAEDMVKEYDTSSFTEDDAMSCASVEVKDDGVRMIQFLPGSEYVGSEDIDEASDEAPIKAEDGVEPIMSVGSLSVASLLCLGKADVVKSGERDEDPSETVAERTEELKEAPSVNVDEMLKEHSTSSFTEDDAISCASIEVKDDGVPMIQFLPGSEYVGSEDVDETTEAVAEGIESDDINQDTPVSLEVTPMPVPVDDTTEPKTDSNNSIHANEKEVAHPMPSAPTLSKLPSAEDSSSVDNNASPEPESDVSNANAEEVKVILSVSENFNEEMKANDAKKQKKAAKGRKTVRNVEHLFEPSEVPLERTVSDTEVIMMSMEHDDEDVDEAYELVKPASWHGVERQYADSEEEEDDNDSNSVVTHLSDIGEESFVNLSKCGLSDGMHATLLWWGEKMYNICPEPGELTKKQMVGTARMTEEAAYVMRDICQGKL